MKILITGANGFIARHIRSALQAEGHAVLGAARRPQCGDVVCDFTRETQTAPWLRRVADFDGVINCVGLLSASDDHFRHVHVDAPAAIATACAQTGKSFLHISILNLDQAPQTPYFNSKRDGENAIRHAYPGATVVRPSLVFGANGAASRMLVAHATMPFHVLPKSTGLVVPIHVDDLAALCATLIGTLRAKGMDVDAVGSKAMTMAELLRGLRAKIGREAAPVLEFSSDRLRRAARVGEWLGLPNISPTLIDLMAHRHTGHPQHFLRWMRRDPIPFEQFLDARPVVAAPRRQVSAPRPV
jgi:uncharacterized protein YbjT (DUF2867 family)